MGFLVAGVCVLGLLAGVTMVFLLTIPAAGNGGLVAWRQTHERVYRNSLELSAAVVLVVLLVLFTAAVWLILR